MAEAETRVDQCAPAALPALVDSLALQAGEYFAWIALVAGAGYKTELPLAQFYRRVLAPRIGGSHLQLLVGLSDPVAATLATPYAVHSLDWYQPTSADGSVRPVEVAPPERHARLRAERAAAEAAARAALANRPALQRRFDTLLATAQRYAALREEIVSTFPLAWPALRRAAVRMSEHDAAVQEARERVRVAIRNSGFPFPMRRITVNLAPAEIQKTGPTYKLPMALSILAASGQVAAVPPDVASLPRPGHGAGLPHRHPDW